MTNVDGAYWAYAYDALGQVTNGVKHWGDGTPVAGEQLGYGFDSIGNRLSTAAGGDQSGFNLRTATYSANTLNQYTSRTVPNAVDVVGSATNAATVTVNGQATYRKNDYYRLQLGIDNSTGPVFQAVTNLALLNRPTYPLVSNSTGSIYLPQNPENFTYDADGNLSTDGRWSYTWDAENRLVSLQGLPGIPTAAKFRLDFIYDYLGRRIQKMLSTNNGSAYFAQSTNRFMYDGWNLLAILNPQTAGPTVIPLGFRPLRQFSRGGRSRRLA